MKSIRYTLNGIVLIILSCTMLFAQETYEVNFTVDLSVQETAGIFDASSQTPRVTGNFADWATTQAPSLINTGNGIWTATLDVTTDTSITKIEYKFILTNSEGNVFWEYAFGFNEQTKVGTIEVGDELKVAGINMSWNGGSMLGWAHAYEVVSTGNATLAQQIGLADLVNDGEFYENKLVQIYGIQMNEEADTLRGGFLYEIIEPSTGTTNYMWFRGGNGDTNSDWEGLTPPEGLFSFKGVVQQVNLSIGTFFVPVPIDFSDITQQFSGTIISDGAGSLLGDTSIVDIRVDGLNTILYGFEAEIHYDLTKLSVSPLVTNSYAFDDF